MAHTICLDELTNPEPIYHTCVASQDPIFVSAEGCKEKMVILNYDVYRKLFARLQVYQALEEGERDVALGRESDAFEMLDQVGAGCRV